ncbi:hypothetical protein H331_01655 [Vibrio parahaemolyticus 3644]|nr:hypothetical protein H331_01655 [Vibrio parahaemolyticus 3644]
MYRPSPFLPAVSLSKLKKRQKTKRQDRKRPLKSGPSKKFANGVNDQLASHHSALSIK